MDNDIKTICESQENKCFFQDFFLFHYNSSSNGYFFFIANLNKAMPLLESNI